MNITVLGHVCIDQNISERSSYREAGGPGMFMDKIFRQFPDTKTTIISSYGIDFLPLQGPTTLIPKHPTSQETLVYENVTKNTIRRQKAYNRTSAKPVSISEKISKMLAKTDLLVIAPLLPQYKTPYLRSVIASTNPHTLKLLLPQGYYRSFDTHNNVLKRRFKEAFDILRLVDIVIVSEKDHAAMEKELNIWTQKNPQLIAVMTLAEKGALAIRRGKKYMLPAIPVPQKDIVDSVGSGDIFSAGFAYRYRQTKNIRLAGAFANALARQCLLYTPRDITIDYLSLP